MSNELYERFLNLIEKDRSKYIKDFIINWEFIDKTRRRGRKSDEVDASDFFQYGGVQDLITWFNWLRLVQPCYFGDEYLQDLLPTSLATDQAVFRKLGLEYDFSIYHQNIGSDNVLDFKMPFLYPSPKRYQIKRVLDFGAGYGRQANLWSNPAHDFTYIAMDAIPKSYCLQNAYFTALDRPFVDYLDSPDTFKLDLNSKGISHIPTWRFDLVPDHSLDLVICIQVLPELSTKLVTHVTNEFFRVLKPGGMLYIRDCKEKWVPAGKVNKERLLTSIGFVKEFEAHIMHGVDLHGIPRIWRKPDPEVMNAQTRTHEEISRQRLNDLDAMTGGLLSKVKQTLKKQ